MDKKILVKCAGSAVGVTVAMFMFRLVMAGLTDVTVVSLHSLSFGWVSEYFRPLLMIAAIGLVWLVLSMLLTQYSCDLSDKKQTASMTMVMFNLIGVLSGVLFLLGYQFIRAEKIPPIGLDSTFWRIVLLAMGMSILGSYFSMDMLRRMDPTKVALKEEIPCFGVNGFWISMTIFVMLNSVAMVMSCRSLDSSVSLAILNKEVVIAIIFAGIAQCVGISFTLVKAKMTDSTRISVLNFLSQRWIGLNIKPLIVVVLMATVYMLSFLLSTQYSSNASNGAQTATMLTVITGMIGGILGFVQFLVFKVARSEKLPPLGFNGFWISLSCITVMTLISVMLNIGLLNEMTRLR